MRKRAAYWMWSWNCQGGIGGIRTRGVHVVYPRAILLKGSDDKRWMTGYGMMKEGGQEENKKVEHKDRELQQLLLEIILFVERLTSRQAEKVF